MDFRSGLVLLAFSGLTACGGAGGDPATQEPVTMEPGAYEVSLSGPIPNLQGPGNPTRKICIQAATDTTPKLLVSSMLIAHEACDLPSFKREGNKLTGTSVCPVDPEKATGKFSTSFEGTISKDAISGFMAMEMDFRANDAQSDKDLQGAKQLINHTKITFNARRIGECDGSEDKRNMAGPQRAGFGDDTIEGGGPLNGAADAEPDAGGNGDGEQ